MGDYTKLNLAEANVIVEMYGLGEVRELTALSLGISNSNYKVKIDKHSYLLKVSNDKNEEQLASEMKILKYLNKKGFKLSLTPHTLKDGSAVYHHHQKFGVLFPFVQGIPPGPSDITCREIGKSLAILHQTPIESEDAKSLREHEEVGFGAREVLDYTKNPICPTDFKESVTSLFPHNLEAFLATDWQESIIHGDLYYDNTLFHNEHLAVMLDFEQAGIGEAILDIGISVSGTCLEKGFIIPPLVRSFMKGYESVRPLSKDEKMHLADAIILGLLSISLWRIKRFKEKNLNPLMADSYKELLRKAHTFAAFLRNESLL